MIIFEWWTLGFSSNGNRELKVKLWWAEARERKKGEFFVAFISSEGRFFTICVLSQYIAYWVNLKNIYFCIISKNIISYNQSISINQNNIFSNILNKVISYIFRTVFYPVRIFDLWMLLTSTSWLKVVTFRLILFYAKGTAFSNFSNVIHYIKKFATNSKQSGQRKQLREKK